MINSGQRDANRPTAAPIVHVVDDDDSFRTAIARLLRAKKYEVRVYASADDFLSHHGGHAPGCIVLDLRMPGASGLDLQEELAIRSERLPIIFLSGHGDVQMRTRATQAGAIAFLHKPIRSKDLFEAIEKAFDCDAQNRLARE
jgi:FixJ family two-component response regulator